MAVMDVANVYGNGVNSTYGQNNKTFYYDKYGIQVATARKVYQQFADSRTMPTNTGQEYRVSIFHLIYDRLPFTDDTWNDVSVKKVFSESFKKYGYLSARDIAEVGQGTYGSDGIAVNGSDNGARLLEAEGEANKLSIKKSTITTKLQKFGEMLDYTEEALMFSEDKLELDYRRQLGLKAGQLYEDLLQLDMLATPNRMYSGVASSMDTMGAGIGTGTPDAVTLRNAVEESYKVSYELLQKAAIKLDQYRCPPRTSILTGSEKFATTPVPASHYAIIPIGLRFDLENCVRGVTYEKKFCFIRAEFYGSQTTLAQGEIGSMHEFRFITSESAVVYRGKGALVDDDYVGSLSYSEDSTGVNRFDVYPILIPGPDSFSTISLAGKGRITFIHVKPEDAEKTDPFGVKGFFSYKFWYASIITRPERLMLLLTLGSK